MQWLTSNATLRAQTALSLKDRSQHFMREHPAAHMNPTLLREVYRRQGIKKKKLRWYKYDKNATEAEIRRDLARMKRQITMATNDGYRLVYLDETMFTRKTLRLEEWSKPKENVRVDEALLKEPTLALLSAISKERGQEHFRIFPMSVNSAKFWEWLEELREKNQGDKIALFMDQLSCHVSDDSKKKMRELGFRWIYNVSYSPQWNPIELVFSKLKGEFKKLRMRKLLGLTQESHEALIEKAVKAIRKQDVVNCVKHVNELLK